MTPQWYLDRYAEAQEREARKPKMRQVGWVDDGWFFRDPCGLEVPADWRPVFVLERET